MTQEQQRIEAGLQCPECFGANTGTRYEFHAKETKPSEYECRECGCNWSKCIKVAS